MKKNLKIDIGIKNDGLVHKSQMSNKFVKDPMEIESIFIDGVKNIRAKEREVAEYTEQQYEENLKMIREKVALIVEAKRKRAKDSIGNR